MSDNIYACLTVDSWSHPWEGFCSSFAGCTQDELDWVPMEYTSEVAEPGWPAPGTLSWHLNHVGACKQSYTWQLRNPGSEGDGAEWVVCRLLGELLEALHRVHTAFIEACASFDGERLIQGKGGHAFPQFLGIALRHEIWHAGQIAMLRRLYARRVA